MYTIYYFIDPFLKGVFFMEFIDFFQLNPFISLSFIKSTGLISVSCKIKTSQGVVMSQSFDFDYCDFLENYYAQGSRDDFQSFAQNVLHRKFRPFEKWCFEFYSITPYYVRRAIHQNKKLKRSLHIPLKLAKAQKVCGTYKKPKHSGGSETSEANVGDREKVANAGDRASGAIDFTYMSNSMKVIVEQSAASFSFELFPDYAKCFMQHYHLYKLSKKQENSLFDFFKKCVVEAQNVL